MSPVTPQTAQKLVAPRQSPPQPGVPNLKLLQTYLFIGQIDQAKMSNIKNA